MQQASFYYTAGIANSGSHMFDLMRYFFGDVSWVQAHYKNDKGDPNIDGIVKFRNGLIATVQSLEDEYYFPGARPQTAWSANCVGPSQGKSSTEMAKEIWGGLLRQEAGMTRERSIIEAENLANQAAANWKSCGGYCTTVCQNYLRPSENSIMNKYYLPTEEAEEFNRISRLHLQNVINRNTLLQLD